VLFTCVLATSAFAHDVKAPEIVEEPHAEWPDKKPAEHDVIVPVVIQVGADGVPVDVDIEASVGPAFDAAALATAYKFRFKPAMADGKAVVARVRAVVRFPGQLHAEEHAHGVAHHHDDVEHEDPHEQIEHAHEHEHEQVHEEEVRITSAKVVPSSASEVHISQADLDLRPRFRPADIVESVPGLFAVQHAGGGKANQYFLRGFDADHGTDVAFFADGVPINMPSHAHGQGFTDLHFVIPELVSGVDGWKGTYHAHLGNFATAGAVDMRFAESFEESRAQLTVGQYGIFRGLVIESPKISETWRAVVAAELAREDGPFKHPEDLTRFNVFAKVTHD